MKKEKSWRCGNLDTNDAKVQKSISGDDAKSLGGKFTRVSTFIIAAAQAHEQSLIMSIRME